MGSTLPFSRRIGVSTLCLPTTPWAEAIRLIHEAGFGAFELVPHLYGGPEQIDRDARQRLRDQLACFDLVTVHSSSAKLPDGRRANIASEHERYRRESVDHYLALAQLALDIGASLATFHAGYGTKDEASDREREAHLMCAREIADIVRGSDLKMGFEYFDWELAAKIDRPRFGVLFDIGHAAMRSGGDLTAGSLVLMENLAPYVVQYHVHGVSVSEDGQKADHQSFAANNGIDYSRIVGAIGQRDFAGPLILEIEAWRDEDQLRNLRHAAQARDALVAMWEAC